MREHDSYVFFLCFLLIFLISTIFYTGYKAGEYHTIYNQKVSYVDTRILIMDINGNEHVYSFE